MSGQPKHQQPPHDLGRRRSEGQLSVVVHQQLIADGQATDYSDADEGHLAEIDDHILDPEGDDQGEQIAKIALGGQVKVGRTGR